MIENKIKIRVMINTTETVYDICLHMSHPLREYIGFDKSAKLWSELAKQYPDLIYIRIANVPILHRTYIIKGENGLGWANIKYYMYGNFFNERAPRLCLTSNDRDYQQYEDEFEYIWRSASSNYSSIDTHTSSTFPQKSKNELLHNDNENYSFVTDVLKDNNCTEMNILSILAYYCASGELSRLIKKRLTDDTGFILRMVLPNPKNIENLKKWYTNFEPFLMSIFSIFCSWCKEFPDRFQLHYTDLPITDRMYINKNRGIMFVDHISIPGDTNFSFSEIIDVKSSRESYEIYEKQFESIWNDYSIDVTLS